MRLPDTPKHAGLLVQAATDLQRLEEEVLLGRAEAIAAVDLTIRSLSRLSRESDLEAVDDIIDAYELARAELAEIDPQTLPNPADLNFLATRLGLLELCTAHLTRHLQAAEGGTSRSKDNRDSEDSLTAALARVSLAGA